MYHGGSIFLASKFPKWNTHMHEADMPRKRAPKVLSMDNFIANSRPNVVSGQRRWRKEQFEGADMSHRAFHRETYIMYLYLVNPIA